ncbi:MAG: hypothetical protein AAFQ88_11465 [Pseudomonadota bacterium]
MRVQHSASPYRCLAQHVALAVLTLALLLRVLAGPALASPPAPGMIPICLGGQIVYVALDGFGVDDLSTMLDEGPAEETATRGEPCPAVGFALAVAPPPPLVAPRAAWPIVQLRGAAQHLPVRAHCTRSRQARAPPLQS